MYSTDKLVQIKQAALVIDLASGTIHKGLHYARNIEINGKLQHDSNTELKAWLFLASLRRCQVALALVP